MQHEDVSRHAVFLRRLASQLVRDPAEADDLVQESWLAALRRPPRERAALRSWLVRVLHRLVGRRQVAAGRRRRREHRAARPELIEVPGMDRQEILEDLVRHLRALPAVHRDVLFLRFFDELSFPEIARRLGISAEAARSRHRRALAELRQRLEADPRTGPHRLVLLLPAALPPAAAPEAATAGGSLMGWMLMTAKLKAILAAVLVVATAGTGWWWLASEDRAAKRPPSGLALAGEGSSARDVARPTECDPDARIGTAAFEEPAAGLGPGEALVCGRCVDDATGMPLAGCTVKLDGYFGDRLERRRWAAEHGHPWEDLPAVTTGPDGRFAFQFVPPPRPGLDVSAPGCAAASGELGRLAAGSTLDVGEVRLVPGVEMTGLVIDEEGKPEPDQTIYLDWKDAKRGPLVLPEKILPRSSANALTGPDGTFRAWCLLPLGRYGIKVRERPLASAAEVDVGPGVTHLQIVLVPDSRIPKISGVVVDDTGAPVERVHLDTHPRRNGWMTFTDANGAFVIRRQVGDPGGPFRLVARRDGYEETWLGQEVGWGTDDVRVVIPRGAHVRVMVVDGETGDPVEEFGVRCLAEASRRTYRSGEDLRERFVGHHAGGVLVIPSLPEGEASLIAVPVSGHAPSRICRFTVGREGAPPQRIEVFRPVETTVRVRFQDGHPAASTGLDVVRRVSDDDVIRLSSFAVPPETRSTELMPVLLAEGEADATGAWTFSAPPHERLALRVLGPGCVPRLVDVTLEPGGDAIDVIVSAGSRIEGSLSPPEFLEGLWPPEQANGLPPDRYLLPGLTLERDAPRASFPPGDERMWLGRDGTFAGAGAPPGRWALVLHYPAVEHRTSSKLVLREAVDIPDEATLRLDLDLRHLLPCRLVAHVLVNGRPWSGRQVSLWGGRTAPPRQRFPLGWGPKPDANGRFELTLWPGEYRVVLREEDWWIPDPHPLVLRPGATERQLAFSSVPLDLWLLGADGKKPAAGARLVLTLQGIDHHRLLTADEEGHIHLDGVTGGATFDVAVRPRRLADDRAWYEARNAQGSPPELVPAGTIAPAPGSPSSTLVLPEAAGY